ncbi:hypothetical protein [Paracoccus benzoatiresistens]|uniref:RecT family protein n=1 Tax=Paracoccus benzoatiresistens TaxID=2997341 RepID=A0ABT4J6W5_9RHOB|nr:hypothetical protein [Paracoccus sp. EF6]MCZ0962865.1 hypothetical protein [Paracoccus sp. EF6]
MNTMTHQSSALAMAPEGQAIAPQNRPSMGILNPTNLAEAMEMAKLLADSSIVPKDFVGKPGNVLVAVQWGAELGLAPLQAMQSIAVINGRPSIWGDAMLALVQGSGVLESIDEVIREDGQIATCTIRRRGQANPVVRQFTMDEAKKAGLVGKAGPWQQYPRRMLQLRARGFALRDAFADVLRGVAIAEEVRDTPVMRDVTPEEGVIEGPATASAKVRNKIAEKKAPAVTLSDVKDRIAAAKTEDELQKVGADCTKLSGDEKAEARKAYSDRLAALKTPAEEPKAGTSLTDLIQNTDKGIRRELTNGAPYKATLDFYGTELAQILEGAPDEHAAMMAEYEQIAAERDGADA